MRVKNINVINNWTKGQKSRSHTGNLSTDGVFLFSYNLVIGWTNASGEKVVTLYTAPNNGFKSMTTSRHVGYAKREANSSELPLGAEMTKSSIEVMAG